MALNLANEDDGGSQIEISQKDNPSSNAGKVTGVFVFFDDQCSVKLWALFFFLLKAIIHSSIMEKLNWCFVLSFVALS